MNPGTPGPLHLTFDDGPDPEWTPRILDALREARAVATFFVLSSRAACHPDVVARIVADGHRIGLHGNLHLRHDTHPAATVRTDTAEALALLAPLRPRHWRPPHGVVADITVELAREHGLELVLWSADSVDWRAGEAAAGMLARLEPLLAPHAIVLMHDAVGPGATRGDPAATVELIGPLVATARARGLEPAPLS